MSDKVKVKETETCPHCSGEYEKLHAHIRHCKAKPQEVPEISPVEAPAAPQALGVKLAKLAKEPQQTKPSRWSFMKKKPKHEIEPPTRLLTMAEKLDAKEAITDLSPEEKFKRFFAESHIWSIEPPKLSLLDRFKNIFVKSDVEFKKCVFVSEDADPKFGYYPYDPKNKYLFLPDGRIYDVPQSGDIWFFNANRFLPLIHSRDPGDLYDLPIHHVTAIHNDGVQYGQSMGFTDLIDSIKSISIISKICAAVAVVCVVGSVIIVREIMKDYASLAADVQTLKLLLTGGV